MAECLFQKKTDDELKNITKEVVQSILAEKKVHISKIILFGSYARGDATEGSDIDIMILCKDDNSTAQKHLLDVFHRADKVAFENDILIQIDLQNESFFDEWSEDLPYYKNIKKEGVVLYG